MYVFLIQRVSPGDQSRAFNLPHGIAAHNNRVYLANKKCHTEFFWHPRNLYFIMEKKLIDLVAQGYLMKQKSLLSIDRLGHDIALGDDVAVYVYA